MARRITIRSQHRRAMTLVELVTVVFVLGILIALLLPGIQSSREGARKTQCANNLLQIATGVHHYYHVHQVFPPGVTDHKGPVRDWPQGHHHSWLTRILPYVEGRNYFQHVDFSVSAYHRNNARIRSIFYSIEACPAHDWIKVTTTYKGLKMMPTTYAGVHHDLESEIDMDNHGMLFLNSVVRRRDLHDGAGQTLMVGEKIVDSDHDLGWISGTRATLRNTGVGLNVTGFDARRRLASSKWQYSSEDSSTFDEQGNFIVGPPPRSSGVSSTGVNPTTGRVQGGGFFVGGFSSHHISGVQFAFADGRVAFVEEQIELRVLQQLAHRSDGGLLDLKNVQSDW